MGMNNELYFIAFEEPGNTQQDIGNTDLELKKENFRQLLCK